MKLDSGTPLPGEAAMTTWKRLAENHLSWILAVAFLLVAPGPAPAQEGPELFVRFQRGEQISYGLVEGDMVRVILGDLFRDPELLPETIPLSSVRLLAPVTPSKVIAVGLNYQSHIGERDPAAYPGLFAKYPTCLIGPEDSVVRPPDSRNLHYEGEMVIVIGRRAKNVSVEEAQDYVFGVTAGNDISERDWQQADLQWFRAKASDTFGPVGPVIARGLDYNHLLLQTRVNGEVRQSAPTSDLIFGVDEIVSYVSRYVTLLPGDIIFTGTPGTTLAMEPGDVVEVELEGVGVLRNTVVAGGS
jgi:2-keto-4-pentenoate hydratase/2-oxohepta-3-ene-1,7-dioic acid hydratase in catechol pathway